MEILKYNDEYKPRVLEIWEDSVRATHHFLKTSDIDYYKSIVKEIDFNQFDVYCSMVDNAVTGFIGIHENKVEMLFIDSEYFNKGHGKSLMNFAITNLNAAFVDVKEGNENARNFYKHLGFVIYDRTVKDGEGKDYSILKMRLDKLN